MEWIGSKEFIHTIYLTKKLPDDAKNWKRGVACINKNRIIQQRTSIEDHPNDESSLHHVPC